MTEATVVKHWLKRAKSNLERAKLLESGGISIPEEVTEAVTLTDYAVTIRYPEVYDDAQESEYQESLVLAEQVFTWVKEQIEEPLDGTVDPHADEKPEEESN